MPVFSILDCIPDPAHLDSDPDFPKTIVKLKKTLQEAGSDTEKRPPPNYDLVQSKVTLQALGINLGDKVVVGGVKVRLAWDYLNVELLYIAWWTTLIECPAVNVWMVNEV